MRRYINNFNSISASKEATLYSPVSINVSDGSSSKILMSDVSVDDTELCVKGDSLSNLYITEKLPERYFIIKYGLTDYYMSYENGETFEHWVNSVNNKPIGDIGRSNGFVYNDMEGRELISWSGNRTLRDNSERFIGRDDIIVNHGEYEISYAPA